MFDFANILFGGPCNARCPFCIGRQIDPRLSQDNLHLFPPRNLERLIELMWEHQIDQVILSGTTTDPQLYVHEERLIRLLRERLPTQTRLVLHTNGRLALRKMDAFNQYDRAAISLPSFNAETYRSMMGVPNLPDLGEILQQAAIPVKISCVVSDENAPEMDSFIKCCQEAGVRRVVLRKLYGDNRSWQELLPGWADKKVKIWESVWEYRGNPVYDVQGLEMTLWDFDATESASVNLFSNGYLSNQYLLSKANNGYQKARDVNKDDETSQGSRRIEV
jgi:MoaA/NifB/PqqE/SkfB family radical SAM enzyme